MHLVGKRLAFSECTNISQRPGAIGLNVPKNTSITVERRHAHELHDVKHALATKHALRSTLQQHLPLFLSTHNCSVEVSYILHDQVMDISGIIPQFFIIEITYTMMLDKSFALLMQFFRVQRRVWSGNVIHVTIIFPHKRHVISLMRINLMVRSCL